LPGQACQGNGGGLSIVSVAWEKTHNLSEFRFLRQMRYRRRVRFCPKAEVRHRASDKKRRGL